MSLLRKVAAPAAAVVAGVGIALSGAPPELAAIGAAAAGQVAGALLPSARSRDEVVADLANRARRAEAYEAFGSSVALAWQAGGYLLTFRPRVVGYLHGLALLVRAQRRFEDEMAHVTAALSNVLLYASSETQAAALDVFRTFGEKLTEAGRGGKPGSLQMAKAYENASVEIGRKVVVWRTSAAADLGASSSSP